MMKKIRIYFDTEQGIRVKNMCVCFGASAVLAGALFKIQHWPGAGPMLTVGMLCEVFIFALFGLLTPHKEYHWDKLYPGLDVSHELAEFRGEHEEKGVAEQLNQALEQNKIGPELVQGLGENLSRFGEQVGKLTDLSDASTASNAFAQNANEAAQSLGQMRDVYHSAIEAASDLATASQEAGAYHGEMTKASTNMAALNELYEVQLRESGEQASVMGKLYESVSQIVQSLDSSVEGTSQYRAEVDDLAKNVATLNTMYANAAEAASTLGQVSEEASEYREQMSTASRNLSTLNETYETQIQETNDHVSVMNRFQGSVTQIVENLEGTIEDTQSYRGQIADLARNISSLNAIYGNMLSAMTMGTRQEEA